MSKLPKPFLGRILMKALDDDVEQFVREKAGLSKNSLIALPEDYKQKHSVPVKKGEIIDMAVDAFGEAFKKRYGEVGYTPVIGDAVMYIPGQDYRVDLEDKYRMIADEDIIAIFPKTHNEVKTNE